jgi:hypothetical protein
LQSGPTSQAELARTVGITQPRVSQLLKSLVAENLVVRRDGGWGPADWDRPCDWWLDCYPGPGGVTTHWYSPDQVMMQAVRVAAILGTSGRAAISGGIAAAQLVSMRTPLMAVVYTEQAEDLGRHGWDSVDAAAPSLVLINPKDPGVWATEASAAGRVGAAPLADTMQVLWDLAQAPYERAADAADLLRARLREQSRAI